MKDIVTSYHCMQFQKKPNEPSLRKWQKNLVSGPILAHLAQIWSPKIFFVGFLHKFLYLLTIFFSLIVTNLFLYLK